MKFAWPQERWPLVRDYRCFPYYVQAAIWCWRKPVWVGLPLLAPMCLACLLLDLGVGLSVGSIWAAAYWGK